MKASEEGIVELNPKEGIRVKQIKIWGIAFQAKGTGCAKTLRKERGYLNCIPLSIAEM